MAGHRWACLFVSALWLIMACTVHAADRAQPAYETQAWPAARELVWAKPGTSGNLSDAANWLHDGKPAATAPDRETDIRLPASDKPYQVRCGKQAVRHAVIEREAMLVGKHRNEVDIWGNLHVKAGGAVAFISIRGPAHTWFRIDDADYPDGKDGTQYYHVKEGIKSDRNRTQISHKFEVCKYGDASVEFIGRFGVSDEIMLQSGRTIISGELRWSGVTNKGALEIYDGATLELQSGAVVGPFESNNGKRVFNIDVYRNGTIQAGSPERPLTKDAYLLTGYGNADTTGATGLFAAAGSQIRVYSSDPTRARLVFSSITSRADWRDGRGRLVGKPDSPARDNMGIALQLAGDVQLDGVLFDYVARGGIKLADPAMRRSWRNIAFGTHNAGPPESLFGKFTANPHAYYHNRSDGASEFGLTVSAVRSMEEYLKQHDRWKITTSPASTEVRDDKGLKKPMPVLFDKPIRVTIQCAVADAALHYTLDGSDPTRQSPKYSGPIELTDTTRLKVKAFAVSGSRASGTSLRNAGHGDGGDEASDTYSTAYIFK